jgi:Domain of unknown function (DUF1841)
MAQRLPAAGGGVTVFAPSKDDVRRFFCETWRKHRDGQILTPIETMALDWIVEHPEYQDALSSAEAAATEYRIDEGHTNPFLHLSMHLAIAEQLSIDQPPGIRAAYQRLVARRGDAHAAAHDVMECLGEVIWSAQRTGEALPPDEMSARYLECLSRRATQL